MVRNLTNCSSKTDKTQMVIDCNEFKAAEADVRKLLFNSNYDMKKVAEIMNLKNWDKDRVKCFINLLDKEDINLLYASLNHHICGYGEAITQSEWLLKLVLGTSELNTIKYPLLQLVLSTINSNGQQRKTLYELNKDVLRKIIDSLEIILEDG